MRSFLKYTFATVVGVIISSFLLFFLFVIIVSALVAGSDQEIKVKPNTILHISLKNEIPDRSSNDLLEDFNPRRLSFDTKLGLNKILENIDKASHDQNISGIFMELSQVQASISTVEEIRNALVEFKKSEKFIICRADFYTEKSYYLASVADKVCLTPLGLIEFKGFAAQSIYFKSLMQKWGITAEVFRRGKYKSAAEEITEDKMSEFNREQIYTYLNSVWQHTINTISQSRGIPTVKLNELANNLEINDDKSCLENNLVDSLLYKDQVLDYLAELTNKSEIKNKDFVKLSSYDKTTKSHLNKGIGKDKIAVVYASGTIQLGDGDNDNIGSDKFGRAIRNARKDSSIKAIVLRVNSPGGSALASEVILREVELAAQAKPLIVSFGGMAASGGYYISCLADSIVSNENTLTGSIGVIAVMLNLEKLMEDKIGVTVSTVKTNDYSDIFTPFHAMDKLEKELFQRSVDSLYYTFMGHVGKGRNMSIDKVDKIAQGRIWSGKDALDIGLVDVYGGLTKAIEIAAYKANTNNYKIVELPKQKDPFEEILKQLGTEVTVNLFKDPLPDDYNLYQQLFGHIYDNGKLMTRLPYDLIIK